MSKRKVVSGVIFAAALGGVIAWLNPGSVGIHNLRQERLKDAGWCFQHDPVKQSKDDLEHCDSVFKTLGRGDPHQGVVIAIAELTGIDCDKEHANPNLTDKAFKLCSSVWWPGLQLPEK
jgi:hypothetical protein